MKAKTIVFIVLGSVLAVCVGIALLGFAFFWWQSSPPEITDGVSLVYKVDVPADQDSYEQLKQTVDVLQKRLDPYSKNQIILKVLAGNRIEIIISSPHPETRQRFGELRKIREQIERANIREIDVRKALYENLETRGQIFSDLSYGMEYRAELLSDIAEAYDALVYAEDEYKAAASDSLKSVDLAAEVAKAEFVFGLTIERLMMTNIDLDDLENILSLSAKRKIDPQTRKYIPESSPRRIMLDEFIERHTERRDQIEALVAAYHRFAAIKGPLDDPNDVIRLIRGSGVLEFRIAVEPGEIQNALVLRQHLARNGTTIPLNQPMVWVKVDNPAELFNDPEVEDFLIESDENQASEYCLSRGFVGAKYAGDFYILLWDTPDKSMTRKQRGWKVLNVNPDVDNNFLPSISFKLNDEGARLMGDLSQANIDRKMAILLGDKLHSAPVVRSRIAGQILITGGRGGFTRAEQSYLINTLKAGALPARLSDQPISITEFTTQIYEKRN